MIPATALLTDGAAAEIVVRRLDVASAEVDAAMALLSLAEQRRASRFVRARDRRRFAVARAGLRQLLAARLRVRPEAVEFAYGSRGKPALAAPLADSGLCFNVTHADELAAYAFSFGPEIGVDIEAVQSMPDADSVAAKFFSPSENAAYRALDAREKTMGFFNCWTRKEAFVKAIGAGLGYALDSFDVSLVPTEPARFLRIENRYGPRFGWSLHSFVPARGFIGAVVIECPAASPN